MNKKIGSFISTVITLLIASIIFYIGFRYLNTLPEDGLERLSLVIVIPIGIFALIILSGLLISSTITSIKGIGSSIIAIKILSIMFLIISLLEFGFTAYKVITYFNLL